MKNPTQTLIKILIGTLMRSSNETADQNWNPGAQTILST